MEATQEVSGIRLAPIPQATRRWSGDQLLQLQLLRCRPFLVPVGTLRDRLALSAFACFWFAGAAFFAQWWFSPGHSTSTIGLLVNSAVIAVELVVLPAWFFFFILRMRRPNPELTVPKLRVAIVVTKAPSEPWPVVRATLQAMLAQDYPGRYDVWLADEDPTEDTVAWCDEHGVVISTRRGVAEYHQPQWPRRTRSKEGNLAYFYDRWGYDCYDVVAQLDADHVPAPDYLRRMVTPFADPGVGYVAAPSICDTNAERSWSARGRLFAEAVLHGPTQAGCSGTWAPSCIGSHYAVRTHALREIGGLGPELAEDFSTTLLMNAGGWRGVFALDAIAHGEGPECVADCVRQDFQWARSMTNILLRIAPAHWSRLTPQAKVKLGFCQLWYPLNGLTMLTMVLLPVISLLSHVPLMRVSLGGFYLHLLPTAVAGIGAMLWCKAVGLLRPVDGRPVSWEAILFQFVRWPWAFLGVLQSCVGAITGREFDFKVTPKGKGGARSLPTSVLVPYLVLASVSLLPAVSVQNAGAAGGYYFWSIMNGIVYLGVALAIVVLHARENRVARARPRIAWVLSPKGISLAAVTAALLAGGSLHAAQAFGKAMPRAAGHHRPLPKIVAPDAATKGYPVRHSPRLRLQLGVTTASLAANAVLPWSGGALREVNAFEQEIRSHVPIVMWYVDWRHSNLTLGQLRAVAARHSTPEITWEPWDSLGGSFKPQPAYAMARIAQGADDAYIRRFALLLRSFHRHVLLRFAQEMNGNAYPWSTGAPRRFNTPAAFIAAWRHIHDVFQAVHAKNVRWVWSPVSGSALDSVYPGAQYVDVIGVSGFNGGSALRWGGWRSFRLVFGDTLSALHRLAPSKPVQISEVACAQTGGNKAAWIRDMFGQLRSMPYVTSLVWFNDNKQTQWAIESSRRAVGAFAAGLRTLPRY